MRNVEIKVRAPNLAAVEARLRSTSGARDGGVLHQRDVFLPCSAGRLKLRFEKGRATQLIRYERADEARLRASEYQLFSIDNGEAFLAVAERAWGPQPEVRKTRHLYWVDNIRVHLDSVDGLGCFVELEAVVDDLHDEAACHEAARRLLRDLGLDSLAPESRAYVDLLSAGTGRHDGSEPRPKPSQA
jgi:adenylate cyclase